MSTYLTREGLKKIQQEIKDLQKQKRQLIDEVSRAAQLGDLRENAEYHAAKERLQHVNTRLSELELKLTDVQIIDELETADGEARVGMKVRLRDLQANEEFDYTLVGPDEADPPNGRISIASPMGKSILGKKEGEKVTLTLPQSVSNFKVVKISRATG